MLFLSSDFVQCLDNCKLNCLQERTEMHSAYQLSPYSTGNFIEKISHCLIGNQIPKYSIWNGYVDSFFM